MTTNGVGNIDAARGQSVQVQPPYEQGPRSNLVLSIASVADDITAWGSFPTQRDRQLREFWPTEPNLASAIYGTTIRNAAFSWTLEGPSSLVEPYQEMIQTADLGAGWEAFSIKILTDFYTQDNGFFIELIRQNNDDPTSPVIGIAHLDSGRCRRTGVPEWPVIYIDRNGVQHKLKPWQVIARSEYPSPVETMNGVGLCAVSRVLRSAQFIRDTSIYLREKVGGRNPQAIHLVNGVTSDQLTEAMLAHKMNADQAGYMRFILPLVIGTIDPTATVGHEEIPLASLPEGFDYDVFMRWYISTLSMGLGTDYQDLAPLPGRALGSGAQSLVLHMKSRGKGPAMYIKTMEHLFNFYGVLPRNCTFRYDEQDIEEDTQHAELDKSKAETRTMYVTAGILTAQAVQQDMLDDGEISQEVFDALQKAAEEAAGEERRRFDLTTDVVAQDEEQLGNSPANTNRGDTAGSKEGASNFDEDERLAWESELAAAMDAALADTLDDVRDAVGGQKAFWRAKDDEGALNLPNDAGFWERFRQRMVGAILPFVRRVGLGAAEYNASLGLAVDMDLVNEQVLDFSRTYTTAWWEGIEASTRRSMRSAIVAWQETGLGTQGLPDLVDALEPLFGTARAGRIATTEVTNIFAAGSKLAYRTAGIEQVEFQTARDSVVCPTCGPLDGQRFAVNDAPTPALHVRCRCALLPVANNRAIGGEQYERAAEVGGATKAAQDVVTVEREVTARDDSGRISRVLETVRRSQ